ncbi:MAG: protein kinase [Sandaracinus sp.]|nr:protein kinase [Sandaracinus sp.]MCB9620997.1 protein kinase [Sandaracinus sp.]MCB9622914.1 protein kinase [Sandaracinus sp.]
MAERLPRAFGDYVLERRLGVGGMAETFVARRGATRQRVCVKRVLPAFCRDAEFVRQFEREARLAGRLRHSNVVGVVDFGAVEEELYLALELVEGVDLRALLQAQPDHRLPEDVAALVALDLAYALDYAHTEQVVHRDVTPSNVLLSVRGEVKLADFGVAKGLTGQTLPTASGLLKGKVPYMAPEQMSGGEVDGRSDLFSLGVTLFEMLAGRRPFVGAHDVEVMLRVSKGERPRLGELVHAPQVEPIVDRLLTIARDQRPHAHAVVQALASLVQADSRVTLGRLVREAYGVEPAIERDTAFAPAVLPGTMVSQGSPLGGVVSSSDLSATVPHPMSTSSASPHLAATAVARPGLMVGVSEAVGTGGTMTEGNAAVALVPEPDPSNASGVVARARRSSDETTGALRAPALVEEADSSTPSRSRSVIVSLIVVIGVAALSAMFFVRDTAATSVTPVVPVGSEVSSPDPTSEVPTGVEPPTTMDEPAVTTMEVEPASMQTVARPPSMAGTRVTRVETSMVDTSMVETAMVDTAMVDTAMVETSSGETPTPEPRGGETLRLPTERTGHVRISLVPWGEVWVGERYMGRAPANLELPAGTHTIRIGMGRPMRTERVRVVAGTTRDLEFVFPEE